MASFKVREPEDDPAHLCSEQAHAVYVELLAAHVFLAHVHNAFHAEQGTHGGRGYAVLPGAGFGDDAMFAHAAGKQALAKAVVDLVGAGVEQVLAFEVDFRPAQLAGQPRCQIQRRRASGVVPQQQVELSVEDWISLRFGIGLLQFFQRSHQGLGNITPPIGAKPAGNGISDGAHKFPPPQHIFGCPLFSLFAKGGIPRFSIPAWISHRFFAGPPFRCRIEKTPQGLKPSSILVHCGTAEAVPFVQNVLRGLSLRGDNGFLC